MGDMMAKKRRKLKVKNVLILLILLILVVFLLYKIVSINDFEVVLTQDVYYIGEEYDEKFTATFKGDDVTDKVKVAHNIYNTEIGTYQLNFTYVVNNKEYKVTKEITIKDNTSPVLTLEAGDSITVTLNSEYKEPGYTAIDSYDGDISSKVKVSGKVDTTKEGVYTIKYTVEDSSKNKAIEKRKVTVTKNSPLTMSVSEFSLSGYFMDAQLKEKDMVSSSYVDDTIFAGDSTALYYVMNKVITGKQLWHKEGVTLESIFTQKIYINHQETKLTLIEAIAKNKPKRILLSLGTNSVATMETEYFITKYRELLTEIQKVSPNTDIIVQSIFPVAKTFDDDNKALNNDKINKLNYKLLELCSELKMPFLNTAEVLKDENGTLKDGYYRTSSGEKGVHLSNEGNKVAMEYFKTHAYEY